MADFCMQCSIPLGAPPGWSDFDGMPEMATSDSEFFTVLCEGCGMTTVNKLGECVNPECQCCPAEVLITGDVRQTVSELSELMMRALESAAAMHAGAGEDDKFDIVIALRMTHADGALPTWVHLRSIEKPDDLEDFYNEAAAQVSLWPVDPSHVQKLHMVIDHSDRGFTEGATPESGLGEADADRP